MSSVNSFVLTAIEKAKQIIEQEQALTLSQADVMMLMDALGAPPPTITQKLKASADHYAREKPIQLWVFKSLINNLK